ncbi:MAG: hypothetical protein ACR2NX_07175 [Chthoniobacterales bacterium]
MIPVTAVERQRMCSTDVTFTLLPVAPDDFYFAVIPARFFHQLHCAMCVQLSFRTFLQFAVDPLVVGVPARHQPVGQGRAGETLRDHEGIVAERFEELA